MNVLIHVDFLLLRRILIFTLLPFTVLAQENSENTQKEIVELFKISESNYPVNDEFINGCIYRMPNMQIQGDPYFKNTDWNEGILFINGKFYNQNMLKYDLILDELVMKTKLTENTERLIAVNKSQIDSFKIGLSLFVNTRNLLSNENTNTYFEKIYKGKLSVYKHYEKIFIDMYSNANPAGKFSNQKTNTYLFDNQNLTNINTLKSFLAYFEKSDKEQIRKYLKLHKINYKKVSDKQLVELVDFCTSLIIN